MKMLKKQIIPIMYRTNVYSTEEFGEYKIVIFRNARVYSFGIFDRDSGEEVFIDNVGYSLNHIWIAVIRKLDLLNK